MKVVEVRNVSEAWGQLAHTLEGALEEDSRAGRVLVLPMPVTTVYRRPTERVLFCPTRDANPFFHLVEALWMLAGRQDAATLDRYVRDFGARFAERDGTIHGAYGHRWRHALGFDQLDAVVQKLSKNPQDRQVVIQMWDGACERRPYERDEVGMAIRFLNTGASDLHGEWRDRPCNTHAYVRLRKESRIILFENDRVNNVEVPVLDLTVLCRSNDAVWGAYGANAVHFSVLQEYLAARLGVGVGKMYQVSNNFHVYKDVWDKVRPSDAQAAEAEDVTLGCVPMFNVPEKIDEDLEEFLRWHDVLWGDGSDYRPTYHNRWFYKTARPVVRAWHSRRARGSVDGALAGVQAIDCPAWRVACYEWLDRRRSVAA